MADNITNHNIVYNTNIIKMNSTFDLNDDFIETPWNIIESYFKDQHLERLVRHQLESYNNFVGYCVLTQCKKIV